MTSKERFDLTINHRQPDKVVVDFGATSVTGIHALSVENLRRYYGLEHKPVRITDPYQMLGEIDQELIDIMGVDVVGARGKNNSFGFITTNHLNNTLLHGDRKCWSPKVSTLQQMSMATC
jgi:hypothetical protein